MTRFEKVYELHGLLNRCRYPVSLKKILSELNCAESTFHRLRRFLQNELRAPLEFDRSRGGYYYNQTEKSFELPGIWFNQKELAALTVLENMAGEGSSFIRQILDPLHLRLEKVSSVQHFDVQELRRIRSIPMANRPVPESQFNKTAEAVLKRICLHITYTDAAAKSSQREVSPQRLVRYRDNWYLDAWCHLKNALRSFSLNRISKLEVSATPCRDIIEEELDRYFAGSYGIFAGRCKGEAHLIFSSESAHLVSQEIWHPGQSGRYLSDGRFELKFPFSETIELIMDILRYGKNVEVIGPETLRKKVSANIKMMVKIYQ